MSSMTDYTEKKLLDHALGKAAYTMPPTVYLALFTASPTDTGSTAAEVTGAGYARQAITATMSATNATTGVSANASAIIFPTATADWGTISHLAIMDAATGGNMLFQAPAATAREILSGDVYQIAAGQLTVTFA